MSTFYYFYLLKMEKEWSLNFAFPLLSLLKATGNETAAYNRAVEICRLQIYFNFFHLINSTNKKD
ncbi:unnamed protein product [Brugia timori]|uniref:Uncharacterized protein n=1 Tax=Brugia timori TaxID=42155 RepID=A0A3P7XP94_9BILA|nr:unnamed protein product [Brugia timori]